MQIPKKGTPDPTRSSATLSSPPHAQGLHARTERPDSGEHNAVSRLDVGTISSQANVCPCAIEALQCGMKIPDPVVEDRETGPGHVRACPWWMAGCRIQSELHLEAHGRHP